MMEAARQITFAPRRSRIAEALRLANVDRVLLAASIGLIAFSVFTLASVTRGEVEGQPLYLATRQGLYAVVGIALMIAVWRLDYTRFRDFRITIYAAMLASIAAVLLFGTAVRGSTRWIELPDFRFQPAELAKVLLCVSLAALVFERIRRPLGLRQTLILLALGLAPAALVFLQPDLGSGLVLVVITLAVLWFAGVPWQHFAAIGAIGAVLAGSVFALGPIVGVDVLRGYQEERLTAFLNPSEDPADASYQVNQSVIAVGSGEKTGRGEEATQSEFLFLPERHTDFVFAAIGERFGFAGAALVVCLYALVLWRGLRVMRRARSFYGTVIAGGIVAMLAFQIIVNIGMNLGMMPVTGVTLPLMSYGGSSVLATFLALGLLQSIHIQSGDARTLSGPLRRSATFEPLTAVAGPADHRTRKGRRSRASTKT
jgi:rod shape determining protein RodA